ncbi:MAG: hypothetical protein JNM84_14980 [Planctomycetes bacterium]|nr:hypothetical protein [Planctomycetota bacterium]
MLAFFGGRALIAGMAKLRPALPEGWSGNPCIEVEAPFRLDLPVGTPLLATAPALERWGEVYECLASGGVRIGVKPAHFESLREDARLVVVARSLGELELLASFFRSAAWQRGSARLRAWVESERAELEALRALALEALAAHFGAEDAERVLADPALRRAMLEALQREVLSPIDWPSVAREASGDPAVRELGAWLGESAELEQVLARASGSFFELLLGELGSVPRALWEDPLGAVLEARERSARGLERASRGTAERVLLRSLGALGEAVAADPEAALRRSLAAGSAFADEAELQRHLRDAWRAFLADSRTSERLRALGDEGFAKLEAALRACAADPRVRARLEGLARRAAAPLGALLRELLLDERGTGWNPLLLALLRERLLGRRTPMIVIASPGSGSRVAPGTVFSASAAAEELW